MVEKTDWGCNEEIPMSNEETEELFAKVKSLQTDGKYEEAMQLLKKGLEGPFALVGEDFTRAEKMIEKMKENQ